MDAVCTGAPFGVRAFTSEFLATERTAMTYSLTFQAISSSVVAVLCISLIFLSPIEAGLVTACMAPLPHSPILRYFRP